MLCIALGGIGDLDGSIKYMEKAYDDHDPGLFHNEHYPRVPVLLKQDARYSFIKLTLYKYIVRS
jgi:hypothetical protein